jgi:CBS domain containing-hemolysin-like protein
MLGYLIALILIILSLIGVVLLRTYFAIPIGELKRQAGGNDRLAKALFKAAVFDTSLKLLLWLWIVVMAGFSFVLLARTAPGFIGFLAIAAVMLLAFAWLPTTGLTSIGARLATWLSNPIAWVLNRTQSVLKFIAEPLEKRMSLQSHTHIYEREDLISLLDYQARQGDNRIPLEELEIAKHALSFSSYKARDILISRKKVKTVPVDEVISPILVDELHAMGHHRFPVFDKSAGKIVGLLEMSKINRLSNIKKGGLIRNHMDDLLVYVHEDDSLNDIVETFFKTKSQFFIVVNGFEEYVGIVTLDDVLLSLLGARMSSESVSSEDAKAVSSRHQTPNEDVQNPEQIIETDTEAEETVVE